MNQRKIDRITGFIGVAILMTFIIGLAKSITDGFAGFLGGLPFWIIAIFTLCLVVYDYWDTSIRDDDANGNES